MRVEACIVGVVVAACGACSEPVAPPTVSRPAELSAAARAELEAELTALAATDLVAEAPAPPADGIWTVRHPDGTVAAEGPMRGGRRDGVWRRFGLSGQLVEEGTYAEDRPIGVWALHARDGTWREAVTYSDASCAERPVLEVVMGCIHAPPPPNALHVGGAGELRRCVAWAGPWIAEALAGGRESASLAVSAVMRAQSPELTQSVRDEVRAILARYIEEGRPKSSDDVVFEALEAEAFLEFRDLAWAQEQALAAPEIAVRSGSLRLGPRAAESAGFAARWYRALIVAHDGALRGRPASLEYELALHVVGAARAIAGARPDLALAINQHAMDRLAEVPFCMADLRMHRAEILLAHGEHDDADAAAELAAEAYASGWPHLLSRADRLRARIAAARGDAALAAANEALAADHDARTEALRAETRALEAVFERARASSEHGRYAEAADALEGVIARGDQAGDTAGSVDWGVMLRLHAARARLALGERYRARALIGAAMARQDPRRHAPLLQTLAEIELASGRPTAAQVAARGALRRLEALRSAHGPYHDELEALVARTDAAAGL